MTLWRRLEDDFRTLLATGFEFPVVNWPPNDAQLPASSITIHPSVAGETPEGDRLDLRNPNPGPTQRGPERGRRRSPKSESGASWESVCKMTSQRPEAGQDQRPEQPQRLRRNRACGPVIGFPNGDSGQPKSPRFCIVSSHPSVFTTSDCEVVSSESTAPTVSHGSLDPTPATQLSVLRSLNERYNRVKLYDEVWTLPLRTLSRRYGVSDVALHKTCNKLHVPLPPAGYWAKLAAGKPVELRPPLPPVRVAHKRAERLWVRAHSREEQKSILAEIIRKVSVGQTLTSACRSAGISPDTYRRWQKRQSASTRL